MIQKLNGGKGTEMKINSNWNWEHLKKIPDCKEDEEQWKSDDDEYDSENAKVEFVICSENIASRFWCIMKERINSSGIVLKLRVFFHYLLYIS